MRIHALVLTSLVWCGLLFSSVAHSVQFTLNAPVQVSRIKSPLNGVRVSCILTAYNPESNNHSNFRAHTDRRLVNGAFNGAIPVEYNLVDGVLNNLTAYRCSLDLLQGGVVVKPQNDCDQAEQEQSPACADPEAEYLDFVHSEDYEFRDAVREMIAGQR